MVESSLLRAVAMGRSSRVRNNLIESLSRLCGWGPYPVRRLNTVVVDMLLSYSREYLLEVGSLSLRRSTTVVVDWLFSLGRENPLER